MSLLLKFLRRAASIGCVGILTSSAVGQDFKPSFQNPLEVTLDSGETYDLYPDPRLPMRWYYCPHQLPVATTPDGFPDIKLIQYVIQDDGPSRAGALLRVRLSLVQSKVDDLPQRLAAKIISEVGLLQWFAALAPNRSKPRRADIVASHPLFANRPKSQWPSYPSSETVPVTPAPSEFLDPRAYLTTKVIDSLQSPIMDWENETGPAGEALARHPVWTDALLQRFVHMRVPFYQGGDDIPMEVVPLPITGGTLSLGGAEGVPLTLNSSKKDASFQRSFWFQSFDFEGDTSITSPDTVTLETTVDANSISLIESALQQPGGIQGGLKLDIALPLGYPSEISAEERWDRLEDGLLDLLFENEDYIPKKYQQYSYPIDPIKLVQDWIAELSKRDFLYDYEQEWLERIHYEWGKAMLPENGGYIPAEREEILWEKVFSKNEPVQSRTLPDQFNFLEEGSLSGWQERVRLLWLERALIFLFQVKSQRDLLAREPAAMWEYRARRWGASFGMLLPRQVHIERLRRLEPELTLLRFLTPPDYELTDDPGGVWGHQTLADPTFGLPEYYYLSHWDLYQKAFQSIESPLNAPQPDTPWMEAYSDGWLMDISVEEHVDLEEEVDDFFTMIDENTLGKEAKLASSTTTATTKIPTITGEAKRNTFSTGLAEPGAPALFLSDITSSANRLGLSAFYLRPGIEITYDPSNPVQSNFATNFKSGLPLSPSLILNRDGFLLPQQIQEGPLQDGRSSLIVWFHALGWTPRTAWVAAEKSQLTLAELELGESRKWLAELAGNPQYDPKFRLYKTAQYGEDSEQLSYNINLNLFSGTQFVNDPSTELQLVEVRSNLWGPYIPANTRDRLQTINVSLFHGNRTSSFVMTEATTSRLHKWPILRPIAAGRAEIPTATISFDFSDGETKPWKKNGSDLNRQIPSRQIDLRLRDLR